MPQAEPNLIPSVKVCEQVGIDRSTLSRYVTLGRIKPAIRLPGRTGAMLFHPADVDALTDWYHHARTEQAS